MKFMDPGCDICCPRCKHECADPIKMKISSEHGHCAWLFPSYAVAFFGLAMFRVLQHSRKAISNKAGLITCRKMASCPSGKLQH